MPEKNKTQNEDKQNKEHNTETKKRLPVQMPEKTKHRMKTNKTKNTTQKT
jgi:hypothetical protein